MTVEEILRRIVKAHLVAILVCAAVPLALVAMLELGTATTYTAEVRLQTVSSAPASSTEAEGLSSRVLALATTPELARAALRKAGAPSSATDALALTTDHVTAQRLGESPVVELAVWGADPQVAARTVRALAGQVVMFMNEGNRAAFDRAAADVERRLQEAQVGRDRLQTQLTFSRGLEARADARVALEAAQRTLDQAEEERAALVLADVSRDRVVAIDTSSPTIEAVPSTLVPRSALALLLGLMVGLALAVAKETLRPRIAGVRVLSRTLDAPLLGATGQLMASLANSLALAARRQGVETVVLVGVDDKDEKSVRVLLDALPRVWAQDEIAASALVQVPADGRGGGATDRAAEPAVMLSRQVRFTDRYGVTPAEERAAGVVVVSAGTALRTSLDGVEDMVRAMRWPVVGVVEVTGRRTWVGAS